MTQMDGLSGRAVPRGVRDTVPVAQGCCVGDPAWSWRLLLPLLLAGRSWQREGHCFVRASLLVTTLCFETHRVKPAGS